MSGRPRPPRRSHQSPDPPGGHGRPDTTLQANVVAALVRVGRPIMLEYTARRSCIAATRMGLEVLRYFGVAAVPQPVRLGAFNATAWAALAAGQPLDTEHTDAWSVGVAGVGQPRSRGGWDGHLALLVRDAVLLDLSLDQFSRPEHQLVLAASWFPLPPEFFQDGWVTYQHALGAVIRYQRLHDASWKRSRDWLATDRRWIRPVGRIIRAVRADLASAS
jgi:hypothetical protein